MFRQKRDKSFYFVFLSAEEFLLLSRLKLLPWKISHKYPPESRETKEVNFSEDLLHASKARQTHTIGYRMLNFLLELPNGHHKM